MKNMSGTGTNDDWPVILDDLCFDVADHQVVLSFANDSHADAFELWWRDIGLPLYLEWRQVEWPKYCEMLNNELDQQFREEGQ